MYGSSVRTCFYNQFISYYTHWYVGCVQCWESCVFMEDRDENGRKGSRSVYMATGLEITQRYQRGPIPTATVPPWLAVLENSDISKL